MSRRGRGRERGCWYCYTQKKRPCVGVDVGVVGDVEVDIGVDFVGRVLVGDGGEDVEGHCDSRVC